MQSAPNGSTAQPPMEDTSEYSQPVENWYVEEDEGVLNKMEQFKRRVTEAVPEHYPRVIQTLIKQQNYAELARFGENFKFRAVFSETYKDKTGVEITIRDTHDLYAYMALNSDLDHQRNIAHEAAMRYIKQQCNTQCVVEESDDEDITLLLFEVCNDEKEELFETYTGYLTVIIDDLREELALMKEYLSNQLVREYRIFCDSKHEIKATKPYTIFLTLSPVERMEIVRGTWKTAKLYTRSPLYPVFLLMMYAKEVSFPKDVCVRHPYLMVTGEYLEELAISVASFSRSEIVIREIVKSYAENFMIDQGEFVLSCLNKMR